jgi:hypothetical protein
MESWQFGMRTSLGSKVREYNGGGPVGIPGSTPTPSSFLAPSDEQASLCRVPRSISWSFVSPRMVHFISCPARGWTGLHLFDMLRRLGLLPQGFCFHWGQAWVQFAGVFVRQGCSRCAVRPSTLQQEENVPEFESSSRTRRSRSLPVHDQAYA